MISNDVYKLAIETYGIDPQLNMVKEEFAELIVEVSHFQRGRSNYKQLIDEVSDAYIMLDQLVIMGNLDHEDIKLRIGEKVNRLEQRLTEYRNVDQGIQTSK